jgi:V8-like Glu-specific endopeptidase
VTTGTGRLGECSATVVHSKSRSLVFTAGHCLHMSKGGWVTDALFVPGYRNHHAAFGSFEATGLFVLHEWYKHKNHAFDVGALVLDRNGSGERVEGALNAGRGLMTGIGLVQKYFDFGYPVTGRFNGQRLYRCKSRVGAIDRSDGWPYERGIGCDMTEGASGGGWLLQKNGYLNGLNSFLRSDLKNVMFSPYFGDEVWQMYQDVKDGG